MEAIYTTESGRYGIAYATIPRTNTPGWYFYPNDSDWLAFNHETSFSKAHSSRESALDAAEEWEGAEMAEMENKV